MEKIKITNRKIETLTSNIANKKFIAFGRALKISTELEKIELSIEFIETRVYQYGLSADARKEQKNQAQDLNKHMDFVGGELKRVLEVVVPNPAGSSMGSTISSIDSVSST